MKGVDEQFGIKKDDSANLEILFIHLGESPCQHLWLNLKRTAQLFPALQINLILDSKVHLKKVPTQINTIFWSDSTDNKYWGKNRDLIFRRGFWKHSINRLFALEFFHNIIGEKPILHIESDVILLPNFPWKNVSQLDQLFWQPYNSQRDVASLVFSPSLETTAMLRQELMESLQANPLHTDMSILKEISIKGNISRKYFPILNRSLPSLRNQNYELHSDRFEEYENDEFLEGIFDSAAIGMWLLGHDPRNTYGKFLLHDKSLIEDGDTPVDPRKVEFNISKEGNLSVCSKVSPELEISVWSLHAHSKELALFDHRWLEKLSEYVVLTKHTPGMITKFRGKAVWSMFKDNLSTHTPMRFFAGIPLVHRFRSILFRAKKHVLFVLDKDKEL